MKLQRYIINDFKFKNKTFNFLPPTIYKLVKLDSEYPKAYLIKQNFNHQKKNTFQKNCTTILIILGIHLFNTKVVQNQLFLS